MYAVLIIVPVACFRIWCDQGAHWRAAKELFWDVQRAQNLRDLEAMACDIFRDLLTDDPNSIIWMVGLPVCAGLMMMLWMCKPRRAVPPVPAKPPAITAMPATTAQSDTKGMQALMGMVQQLEQGKTNKVLQLEAAPVAAASAKRTAAQLPESIRDIPLSELEATLSSRAWTVKDGPGTIKDQALHPLCEQLDLPTVYKRLNKPEIAAMVAAHVCKLCGA